MLAYPTMASGPRFVTFDTGAASAVEEAAAVLKAGGLVIFPTETFYGIAACASDVGAVARLARLKEREGAKPISLIAASRAVVDCLGTIPPLLAPLAHAFWPGPLTLVLAPSGPWPAPLLSPSGELGVRVPGHRLAAEIAAAAGGLITSTSANWAGVPPVTSVRVLDAKLVAAVNLVVDGGESPGGLPSTVVASRAGRIEVLRAGAVSLAEIERVLAQAEVGRG